MKTILFLAIVLLGVTSCATKEKKGEQPVEEKAISLPNIFDVNNFSLSMNESITEIYTTVIDEHGGMNIMWSKKDGGSWPDFSPISFTDHQFNDIDPFLSRDGQKLYFISNRDNGMFENDDAIWVSAREENEWGTPKLLSENINRAENEGFSSVASNGTIYFPMKNEEGVRNIFKAAYENGMYGEPEQLGDAINSPFSDSNPAISADESILVFFSTREGGYGETDLYISHNVQGKWTQAVNLGTTVNSEQIEYCPYITHDNNHLFYTRWNLENNIRLMMQVRLDSLLIN